jgi:hypothetical protein
MNFLMARADDKYWQRFADVIVHIDPHDDAITIAESTLRGLSGCALVVVATHPHGCVLLARDRQAMVVSGPVDIEACAVAVYSALLSGNAASWDRTFSALGSSTWS